MHAYAADVVVVDHRLVPIIDSTDRDTLMTKLASAMVEIPEVTMRVVAVHALTEDGVVVSELSAGESREGLAVENLNLHVGIFSEGVLTRLEIFGEADLDAALARFEALRRTPTRLENLATRAQDQKRTLFMDRDWSALGRLIAVDYTFEDRRPGVGHSFVGREPAITNLRSVADVGAARMVGSNVAVRGDRLVLERERIAGPDDATGFHVEVLRVVEVDEDGHSKAAVVFDPGDLDAAYAELDARYLSGEAEPLCRVFESSPGSTGRTIAASSHRSHPTS